MVAQQLRLFYFFPSFLFVQLSSYEHEVLHTPAQPNLIWPHQIKLYQTICDEALKSVSPYHNASRILETRGKENNTTNFFFFTNQMEKQERYSNQLARSKLQFRTIYELVQYSCMRGETKLWPPTELLLFAQYKHRQPAANTDRSLYIYTLPGPQAVINHINTPISSQNVHTAPPPTHSSSEQCKKTIFWTNVYSLSCPPLERKKRSARIGWEKPTWEKK